MGSSFCGRHRIDGQGGCSGNRGQEKPYRNVLGQKDGAERPGGQLPLGGRVRWRVVGLDSFNGVPNLECHCLERMEGGKIFVAHYYFQSDVLLKALLVEAHEGGGWTNQQCGRAH